MKHKMRNIRLDVENRIKLAAITGAGLSMGLGAIGSAVGEGHKAACATEAIGRSPEKSDDIFKNMLVGQAVAEGTGIYALVVSLILIFVI